MKYANIDTNQFCFHIASENHIFYFNAFSEIFLNLSKFDRVDTLKKTNSHTTFQLVRMMSNLSTSTKDKPWTS